MWGQLISMRMRSDGDLTRLWKLIREAEEPGSGMVRTIVAREQGDPTRVHTLVLFDSEEKARAREADPRRQERLAPARALMAEMTVDGPPQFVDLTVVEEWTG